MVIEGAMDGYSVGLWHVSLSMTKGLYLLV